MPKLWSWGPGHRLKAATSTGTMSRSSVLPVIVSAPPLNLTATVGGFVTNRTQHELARDLQHRRSIFDRIDPCRPSTGDPIITIVVTTLGVAIHVAGAPTWHSHESFARDLLRISHETGYRAFRIFLSEEYTENVRPYAYASAADHNGDSGTSNNA